MTKFQIDHRYNHIGVNVFLSANEFDQIYDWCYNKPEAYVCYSTGFVYRTKHDLTMFLLRWS